MTKIDALRELLANVEAGYFPADLSNRELGWDVAILTPYEAFSGSLDAAKALHDAVLPGWSWVKPGGAEYGTIRVFGPDNGAYYPSAVGKFHGNTARAWLIAILKALISEETNV